MNVSEPAGRASFRDVFAVAEFRALWAAQLLSLIGDQLAKIAITVLVYDRTRSPVLAAATFAASFVPAFLGGLLLTGLADRYPRRAVMISCDLARMALAAAMAVRGIPLVILVALLFAVTMIGAPFTAARAALYPAILTSDRRYVTGTTITMTTLQIAQVAGFAGGGVMTGLLGVRACLVADAATFALSALLIRFGVHTRAAPDRADALRRAGGFTGLADGVRLVFSDPALRTPMLLGWLAAFYNCPEGIAAPFARSLGGGAVATGLLLAFPAAGSAIGAVAVNAVSPAGRARMMRPLACAACGVLILMSVRPGLPVALLILAASGTFGGCYQPAANAAFVAAAPDRQRSQAFGLAYAGMTLGQGTAMVLAGAAAQHIAAATVISASGAIGAAAALGLMLSWPSWRLARPWSWRRAGS